MNYFSDEIMTKWSWIVQRNDLKIVKSAIGSQYNKVDPRVAAVIVFVYGTMKIYLKIFQGKSNTLTLHHPPKCRLFSWPSQTPCISLLMSQPVVRSQQSTMCQQMPTRIGQLTTQLDGQNIATDINWTDMGSGLWNKHPTFQ